MATLTTSCANVPTLKMSLPTCLPANCSGNTAKVKRTSRWQTNPKDSSWWTAIGTEQHLWADAENKSSVEPTISWPWNLLTTRAEVLFLSLNMVSHLIRWLYDQECQCPGIQKGFSFCRSVIHLWYLSYLSLFFILMPNWSFLYSVHLWKWILHFLYYFQKI